jgi:hypothetical protein
MSLGTPNGVLIRVDSRFRAETKLKCRQLILSSKGRNVKLKGFILLPQRSGSDFSELITEFLTHRTERLVPIRSL